MLTPGRLSRKVGVSLNQKAVTTVCDKYRRLVHFIVLYVLTINLNETLLSNFANRADPDQAAPDQGIFCLSMELL